MGTNGTIEWAPPRLADDWTFIEFTCLGPVEPGRLASIGLPVETDDRTDKGLIISGAGPIWLYAHLTHLAHKFAWVATYEPRVAAAIVVQSHTSGGPRVGDTVSVNPSGAGAGS